MNLVVFHAVDSFKTRWFFRGSTGQAKHLVSTRNLDFNPVEQPLAVLG